MFGIHQTLHQPIHQSRSPPARQGYNAAVAMSRCLNAKPLETFQPLLVTTFSKPCTGITVCIVFEKSRRAHHLLGTPPDVYSISLRFRAKAHWTKVHRTKLTVQKLTLQSSLDKTPPDKKLTRQTDKSSPDKSSPGNS